eukprot:CAMPEP_0184298006 /NCGR_PEP_ID=MMETSP1049-20130417/8881_1 /TAXON_ID=77928 /ORGANISM="Proteomonas sulcata, Strain CCMP704" /LENGTH=319 /DNA_ID=CAMNT_0026607999 /DNA_START=102 /DNA_END=1059 /DNA_ORIENTATION=+
MAELISAQGKQRLSRKFWERKHNKQSSFKISGFGGSAKGLGSVDSVHSSQMRAGLASPSGVKQRRHKPLKPQTPTYVAFKRFSPLETPHDIPQNRVLPYYKDEKDKDQVDAERRPRPKHHRDSIPQRPHTSIDRPILPTVSSRMNPALEHSADEETWKVLLQEPWDGSLTFSSAPNALVEARRAERNRVKKDMPTLVDSRSLLHDRRLEQLQTHMPAELQTSHLSLYFPFNRKYVDSMNASMVKMKEIEYNPSGPLLVDELAGLPGRAKGLRFQGLASRVNLVEPAEGCTQRSLLRVKQTREQTFNTSEFRISMNVNSR